MGATAFGEAFEAVGGIDLPGQCRYAIEDLTFEVQCYSPVIGREIEVFLGGNSRGPANGRSCRLVVVSPDKLPLLRRLFESGRVVHTSHLYPGVPLELRLNEVGLGLLTLQDRCAILDLATLRILCTAPESTPGDRQRRFINTLLVPVVNVVLEQNRRFLVHGASLALDGLGCLITATSGGGKTTATLALMADGFDLLGDDLSIVDVSGPTPRLKSFSRGLRIVPDSLALFPELRHLEGQPLIDGKIEVQGRDLSTRPPIHEAQPALILFPEPSAGVPVRRLTAAETVERLVPNGLFVFGAHEWQARMLAIIDLANVAAGYAIDNRLAPKRIAALIRGLLAADVACHQADPKGPCG